MTELWEHDAWELADRVRAGDLEANTLLDLSLARIEQLNPKLNAVCFVDTERARTDAERVDRRVAAGEDPGPFAGIPMGVKELAQVQGWPDTNASVPYAEAGAVAEFDCTEVARLREAGAVPLGLTTAPEHGVVSYTNSKLHGGTRNPWNLERTPGGSSGGSAASVAAGGVPGRNGTDRRGCGRMPG